MSSNVRTKAFHIRFGLRAKLLLLSSFLFVIPWFGYQYVWEMEKYLRFGQEQTLVGTARALATALHERKNLFNNQASFLPNVEQGKDLYGYQLTEAIQLDGLHQDWPNFSQRAHFYDRHQQLFSDKVPSLNFKASVGKYDKYLYLFFQVVDNKLVFRGKNSRSITQNDHLALSFTDQNNQLNRFIISNKQSGWISAFTVIDSTETMPIPAPHIQGHWRVTPQGYNIELRVPLEALGEKIAFAFYDVDVSGDNPNSAIGSADPSQQESLGTIVVPSPEIERIVNGMRYTNSSIWVVDQHHRVLASAGSLKQAGGVWQSKNELKSSNASNNLWYQFKQQVLLPLYYQVLTKPPTDFIDKIYDARHLNGAHIVSALSGNAKSQWRLTTDKQALVLSAAYPIYIDNNVQGAVIVEETTNGIRTLRNRALEKLFSVILAIMILGAFTFIIFATRISARIRDLSNQAEHAIDKQGRIIGKMVASTSNDEIGDLSRSFTTAVNRLSEYNHYLENMSSRLSHELRTPIAVVKTSLENLALLEKQRITSNKDCQESPYIERAQTGINTLNLILTNMSEATRLEQMLASTEKIEFDLKTVVSGCIAGYQQVFSEMTFILKTELNALPFYGSPEHIVQLLDKVINNAVEFSQDKIITLALNQHNQEVELLVSNNGRLLPEQLNESLFDSMVSLRAPQASLNKQQTQPHLGLGLYIARLICHFHHGTISATNHYSPDGVTLRIGLPTKV
ncbi:proteobacterial dedicated sortase system histidine kinase [Colwellia sp. KU-HH00111]|uniref:proteobacterial dedicated sortase system histidine kinase n=1 Tax=Colwellia sp. KU-HH00111 TaxID=3127652 RepID=UPI0031057542